MGGVLLLLRQKDEPLRLLLGLGNASLDNVVVHVEEAESDDYAKNRKEAVMN